MLFKDSIILIWDTFRRSSKLERTVSKNAAATATEMTNGFN
ncbi:hypothetical protein HMPREF9413_1329 [Paenibacillus sp. HGF7]|nr:hypothetical protein HMPREF9413_1329 [Paenibacillus sp. HGF7]